MTPRVCVACNQTLLSRYNPDDTCGPCQHAQQKEADQALLAEEARRPERWEALTFPRKQVRRENTVRVHAALNEGASTVEEIAESSGVCERTVRRVLQELIAAGDVATDGWAPRVGRGNRHILYRQVTEEAA